MYMFHIALDITQNHKHLTTWRAFYLIRYSVVKRSTKLRLKTCQALFNWERKINQYMSSIESNPISPKNF